MTTATVPQLTTDRERLALEEMARTRVSRPVAGLLFAAFVALLGFVPLAQLLLRPGSLREFLLARPEAWRGAAAGGVFEINRRLRHELEALENLLDRESELVGWVAPSMQSLLTALGNGNDAVYVGPDGWLVLADDIDHAYGRGFLDPQRLLARRRQGESDARPLEPDPMPALVELGRDLGRRGIRLVVMPVPSKSQVAAATFSRRARTSAEEIRNASFEELRARLAQADIGLFDPLPVLHAESARSGRIPYLRSDSHWSPEGMKAVAGALALELGELLGSPRREARSLVTASRSVTGEGDLRRQLKLADWSQAIRSDTVQVEVVRAAAGGSWQPARDAEVLLLGDSFTNMYSTAQRGFGTSAGLAEHLELALGAPIDRISVDGQPLATRDQLARALASGDDRLAGKRVVVFQFASRVLSAGDWPVKTLPQPPARPPEVAFAPAAIEGRVVAIAERPDLVRSPYSDALIAVRLGEVRALEGETPADLLAYLWAFRDRTPAAGYTLSPGSSIRLRLTPWSEAEPRIGTIQRVELVDDSALALPAYFGEPW